MTFWTGQPERSDGRHMALVSMCVVLATVDEHLRTEGTLNVCFLRVHFALLFGQRLILKTSLLVRLQPGFVDEQLWAVVARHPVGFDELFSMTLIDVKLKVMVVKESHRAVRADDFLLPLSFRLFRFRFIVTICTGTFWLMDFEPIGSNQLVTILTPQPPSYKDELGVALIGMTVIVE